MGDEMLSQACQLSKKDDEKEMANNHCTHYGSFSAYCCYLVNSEKFKFCYLV